MPPATPAPRGHNRKISFQDLALTFARPTPGIGPMVSQQPPGPPAPPQLSQQQMQQQQLEATRRNDLARRQAKKPTDREIPDELADVVVGDGVERYKGLRDAERRLDAVMMRKRLDVNDNLQRRYARREGVLKVWVSNSAEGQPWQVIEEGGGGLAEDGTFDFGESGQATFRVRVEGRLVEEGGEAEEDEGEGEGKKERARFSHFFKAITIDFDRNPALQPDGYSAIEWRKPTPQAPNYDPASSEINFDSLEFERKSDENINVTINLVRDDKNERFRLSEPLAEILDTDEEDRAGVVQGIWEYCRAMGLQEDEDKRSIVCDEPLKRLFNRDTLYFPYVPDYLAPHLSPLPPIQLPYTIRVDKPHITAGSPPTTYTLRVPLPNPLHAHLATHHTSRAHLADLQTIVRTDDDLALLVQKLHQTNAKRKFYENLARDPASFVRRWTSSQRRDLEVVMAEGLRGDVAGYGGEEGPSEEWRRGGPEGVWGSQLASESVGLWLARSSKT